MRHANTFVCESKIQRRNLEGPYPGTADDSMRPHSIYSILSTLHIRGHICGHAWEGVAGFIESHIDGPVIDKEPH